MTQDRILIIKHGALGDMVLAVDAFASVRKAYPDAHLALLTGSALAGFCRAMPFFDDVLIDDRKTPWNIAEWLRLRRLFHSGWTPIFDLQQSSRTGFYAKTLVPPAVPFFGKIEMPSAPKMNIRDRLLLTVERGGCAPIHATDDWIAADNLPPALTALVKANKPYAVLIPGCSLAKPAKRWPSLRFGEVAQALLAEGITPVIVGTAIDRDAGGVVMAAAPQSICLIDKTGLAALAAVLKNAVVAIGNDTGAVFIAAKLGTPTLVIMSRHTDPILSTPNGAKVAWLRGHDTADIEAAAVLAQLQELLKS